MGLELHFHESLVSFGGGESERATEPERETDGEPPAESTESGGAGGAVLGALLALVVLVGIAYAVRKARGGEDGDGEAEIEIDE
ncbi:MAG: hypothetical protein ABEJ68_05490 [Halobacteriaceae archaeon]